MAQTLCVLTRSNKCAILSLACFCPFTTASCLGVSREVAPGSQKHERTLDGTNGQHGRKRRAFARRARYVACRLVSFQAWVFVRESGPPGRRKRVLLRQNEATSGQWTRSRSHSDGRRSSPMAEGRIPWIYSGECQ